MVHNDREVVGSEPALYVPEFSLCELDGALHNMCGGNLSVCLGFLLHYMCGAYWPRMVAVSLPRIS